MKKLIGLFLMCTLSNLHALRTDILEDLHYGRYDSVYEKMEELLDGSDDQIMEASLVCAYVAYKKNNDEELRTFARIMDDMVAHILMKESGYWENCIAE